MKLKNRQTGMIGEVGYIGNSTGKITVNNINDEDELYEYDSLAELNEEWEDYEEPKEFWFVDSGGEVEGATYLTDNDKSSLRNFGNYFETKEEAEKAVDKLNAWKRLKDKGFRFEGIKEDWFKFPKTHDPFRDGRRYLHFNKSEDEEWMKENWEDLDLLFGGEE